MRNLSIKWQLIIICILLVTVPLVVLGLLSFNSSRKAILHNVEETLEMQCVDWAIIAQSYYDLIEKNKLSAEDTTEGIIASQALGVLELIQKHFKDNLTVVALNEPFLRARKNEKNMLLNVFSIAEFENYLKQFDLAVGDIEKVINEAEYRKIDTNAARISLSGYLKVMMSVRLRQVPAAQESFNKDIDISADRLDKEFSAIAEKLSDERLKDLLASTVIGKTGYVYIINYLGEYILSKGRLRDRESIWYVEDAVGRFVIQDVVTKGKNLREGEIDYFPYSWKEPNEDKYREQLVAVMHIPEKAWIIGVVIYPDELIASDFEEMKKEELKMLMAKQTLGKTGGISIIGAQAEQKGQYILSKDRKYDGKNVLWEKDARGTLFIKEIVEDALTSGHGKNRIKYYYWREPWEHFERKKVFAFTYFRPWNWIITASVNIDEFFEDINGVRNRILWTCIIAIVIGTFIIYIFSSLLSRSFSQLVSKMDRVSKGNLDVHMDDVKWLGNKNELGKFANAFKEMLNNLRGSTFSKDYVDNIIGNMNDALFVIDRDARILAVNRITCRLLDSAENEIIKYHIGNFFMAGEEELKELKRRIFDGEVVENIEMELRDKKGNYIPVKVNGSPLEHVEGKVISAILITRDVTEHKKLIKELSDARKDLEDKADRLEKSDRAMLFMVEDLNKTTEALKEARNRLDEKILDGREINKELDDFTHLVSHDLKELLRDINASTKLLMDDYGKGLDKEAKEHLKKISDSNVRMGSLIDDILNLLQNRKCK